MVAHLGRCGVLLVASVGAEWRVTLYNANPSDTESVCFVRQAVDGTEAGGAVLAGPLAYQDTETVSVSSSSMVVETYATTDTCSNGVMRKTILVELYNAKTNVIGYGPGFGGFLETTFTQVHNHEGEKMSVLFEHRALNYVECTFEYGGATQGPYFVGEGGGGEASCDLYRTGMKNISVTCDGEEASLTIYSREICKASSQHLIAVGDWVRGVVDILFVQGDPVCSLEDSCDSDSDLEAVIASLAPLWAFLFGGAVSSFFLCRLGVLGLPALAIVSIVLCCICSQSRRRRNAMLQERPLQLTLPRTSPTGNFGYVSPPDHPPAADIQGLELPNDMSAALTATPKAIARLSGPPACTEARPNDWPAAGCGRRHSGHEVPPIAAIDI